MSGLDDLAHWMITEGRVSGDPEAIVDRFCSGLCAAGVPLWRANIGQRFANPLLIAWGIVWTPDGAQSYDVTHERLLTDGYVGSSFEYILAHREPLHKSLRGLDPEADHLSYLEFAEQGGTDFYATLLYYGDQSLHGCTFVTQDPDGFRPQHLAQIEAALPALSCALEPITMRKSARSLLRTYLGHGPSDAVWNGVIKRGERTSREAVVMFSDLRGFTALSDSAAEQEVFEALDGYFDLVVQAVEDCGGDVLKFMGDGVLSFFPVPEPSARAQQCQNARRAAQQVMRGLAELNGRRGQVGKMPLDTGIGINLGAVSYGNIGSPGRLDFTVLGAAVNLASRIEGLTKALGHRVLVTRAIAQSSEQDFAPCGTHSVRGVSKPIALYYLREDLP